MNETEKRPKFITVPILKCLKLFSGRLGFIYLLKTLLTFVKDRKLVLFDLSTFRFAFSIAGFSSIYPLLKELLGGRVRKQYIPAVSGSIASLFLLADQDNSRTATIAQLVFVRTLYFSVRAVTYNKRPVDSSKNSSKLKIRDSNTKVVSFIRKSIDLHGDHIMWCFVAYVIVYTTYNFPKYISKSYFKGLVYVSGKYKQFGNQAEGMMYNAGVLGHYLSTLKDVHPIETIPNLMPSRKHLIDHLESSTDLVLKEHLQKVSAFKDFLIPEIHHDSLHCILAHPQFSSCVAGSLFTGKEVYISVLKTYMALNISNTALKFAKHTFFKYFKDQKDAEKDDFNWAKAFRHFLKNTAGSCTMMATYIGSSQYFFCSLRRYFRREKAIMYGIGGVLATPAIIFDKPGRLIELNLYCFSKILESLILFLYHEKYLFYSRAFETIIMVPIFAILATIVEDYTYALNGILTPAIIWTFKARLK